jgi:hypothetical protein
MKRVGFLAAIMMLACAAREPKKQKVSNKPIVTIGDFLEQQCDEGNDPEWCEVLIVGLQKDGSPESLARIKAIRAMECKAGDRVSCD